MFLLKERRYFKIFFFRRQKKKVYFLFLTFSLGKRKDILSFLFLSFLFRRHNKNETLQNIFVKKKETLYLFIRRQRKKSTKLFQRRDKKFSLKIFFLSVIFYLVFINSLLGLTCCFEKTDYLLRYT